MKRTTKKKLLTVLLLFLSLCYSTRNYENNKKAYASQTTIESFETDNTKVYYVKDKKDLKKLDKALEKRNGKIIIEIINGKVINKKGDGKDSCGYYIHYNTKEFKKGDKVQSVFVYNPNTNYIDDILYRIDTKIK